MIKKEIPMIQFSLLRRGLAAACAVIMAVSLSACGASKDDASQKIALLEQENAQLKAQIAELQQQLSSRDFGSLESWSLEATGTGSEASALIRFTAVPTAFEAGQSVSLLVLLEGGEAARQACDWDGQRYIASVSLTPADGYSYYCVLTDSAGADTQILLSSPEEPTKPLVTYLASSLESYGNVYLDNVEITGSEISIGFVSAQIQPPLITPDGNPIQARNACLLWLHNGQTLDSIPLELTDGETGGSYAAAVSDLKLALPKLKEDDQLELQLRAELSDGTTLIADGGAWFCRDGSLDMIVG